MDNSEIEQLFESARSGDITSENKLFAFLIERFRLILRKRIWDNDDREELVQNALLTIAEKYKEAEIKLNFISWAHKVLHYKLLQYYSAHARERRHIKQVESFTEFTGNWNPDPSLELELKKCLKKIMSTNPRFGRILVAYYQGYNAEEICKKFEISKNNLYIILHRVRSMLKTCLKEGDIK